MKEIVILIPEIEPEQNIEIDVKINGRITSLVYRVELIRIENNIESKIDRVSVIKHYIQEYNKDWELVEIGAPLNNNIPLTFRKKMNKE